MNYRTNNALVQTFGGNNLNELTTVGRSGTLTVAGTATERRSNYQGDYGVTGVTVSGTGLSSGAAELYADGTWARTNATPANGQNSYTATAQDTYGRTSQDSVTVNLPASASYSYDSNGNLPNDGRRYFEYDWENQLTNVYVTGQWRSEFTYDGMMRRRVRKEYTWSGSAWVKTNEVRYVYDGKLVVQERDGNNLPQVSYTRGNDLSGSRQGAGGIGGLLARTDLSTINSSLSTSYYHSDGNGNVTCLINTNSGIVARYTYDPFGNTLAASGPLAEANLYRFSSKEYHPTSGLVYYLYRFYDPNLQRWLNRDPIGEAESLNLYEPLGNSPLYYVDDFGGQLIPRVPFPRTTNRPSRNPYRLPNGRPIEDTEYDAKIMPRPPRYTPPGPSTTCICLPIPGSDEGTVHAMETIAWMRESREIVEKMHERSLHDSPPQLGPAPSPPSPPSYPLWPSMSQQDANTVPRIVIIGACVN